MHFKFFHLLVFEIETVTGKVCLGLALLRYLPIQKSLDRHKSALLILHVEKVIAIDKFVKLNPQLVGVLTILDCGTAGLQG